VSKWYVTERLKDAEQIEITAEWGTKGKGKYGRWLGVIWVDEENLNEELVGRGYAEVYPE